MRPTWMTESTWEVFQVAKAIAVAEGAREILPRHLFQAFSEREGSLVKAAIGALGLGRGEAEVLLQGIKIGRALPEVASLQLPLSQRLGDIVRQAQQLAREYPVEGERIAPIHLWVSLCLGLDDFKAWLIERGWSEEVIRRLPETAKAQLPQRKQVSRPPLKESELQVLRRFCSRNLTELARQGRLTPAYEAEGITRRIIQCLLRKDKRSVVLTGPAGVGKTKLVEDIALRIVRGEIPELEGCLVFELDLALFTRGTHLAGSRAERWAQLTEVLRNHPEEIILFIDELHTIVGLPLEGQAMDLANALKPLLVDEKVRIIGATTPDEYRKYIEGDPALARRFSEVKVPEPDKETTLRILRRVAHQYEEYHGVRYPIDTLETIYDLARSYLPNLHFPAKAIDLMDEVGVQVRMRNRGGTEQPIVRPEDVREAIRGRWGIEPGEFPSNIADLIKERVVGQDHAAERLADIIITSAFRYRQEQRRGPRAVILLVGPPGVGKSYMAQVLSDILFPGRDSLLVLDMTEFGGSSAHAGEHARWRLLGPPPPYVGWETGGVLTSHVLSHPVSIVLVDEFEKAHPEARNVLLRIFDEGWAQDGRGRIVSFRETYFILTANAGRKLWEERREQSLGFRPEERVHRKDATILSDEEIRDALRRENFSPELLSRISHIVMFKSLSHEDLKKIAIQRLRALRESALMEDFLLLEYEEEAISDWLVKQLGPQPDCRRLAAIFESRIETPLAHWRLQSISDKMLVRRLPPEGNKILVLRLEPADQEVRLVVVQKPAGEVEQFLFEQVAAIFSKREREEQLRQITRFFLGTTG